MASSIDGLGSGLDTTAIISALMGAERLPADRLVAQRLTVLSRGTAWGQIGAGLSTLQGIADAITKGGTLGAATGTSSLPTTAAVTVGSGAQPGVHSLSVQALAAAGSYSRDVASPTAAVGAGSLVASRGAAAVGISSVTAPAGASQADTGTYALEVRSVTGSSAEVVLNGVATTVDTSGGSFTLAGLQFSASALTVGKAEVTVARTAPTSTVADLAAAFNSAAGVASATVLTTTDPGTGTTTTRLLLSSTATGTEGAVTTTVDGLTGLGAQATVRPPTDARFTLDGLPDIVRSSNTVTDLLPGVTLDLVSANGPETTVTIAKDAAAGTAAVKGLVDQLNSVLSLITKNSSYDVESKKSSPLTGDSTARQLTARLQSAVTDAGLGATSTLGALGISLQRDGTYRFDEAAFTASLTQDPTATTALVGSLATGLSALAKASTATDGITRRGAQSATDLAASMRLQLDSMEARLQLTETRLRRTFTALDTALGSLRNQGSWLSSQLNSL